MKRQNSWLTEQRTANVTNIWPGCRHCFCENSQCPADLIIHNYWLNQSALMTRCSTDSRHQYGIFCGELQTSSSRNTTRAGSEEGWLFSQAIRTINKATADKITAKLVGKTRAFAFAWIINSNSRSWSESRLWNLNIFVLLDKFFSLIFFLFFFCFCFTALFITFTHVLTL